MGETRHNLVIISESEIIDWRAQSEEKMTSFEQQQQQLQQSLSSGGSAAYSVGDSFTVHLAFKKPEHMENEFKHQQRSGGSASYRAEEGVREVDQIRQVRADFTLFSHANYDLSCVFNCNYLPLELF